MGVRPAPGEEAEAALTPQHPQLAGAADAHAAAADAHAAEGLAEDMQLADEGVEESCWLPADGSTPRMHKATAVREVFTRTHLSNDRSKRVYGVDAFSNRAPTAAVGSSSAAVDGSGAAAGKPVCIGDPFAASVQVAGASCLAICSIDGMAASGCAAFQLPESVATAASTAITGRVLRLVQADEEGQWLWDGAVLGTVKAKGRSIVLLDPAVVPSPQAQPSTSTSTVRATQTFAFEHADLSALPERVALAASSSDVVAWRPLPGVCALVLL